MDFRALNSVVLHVEDLGPVDRPALVFANSLGTDFRIWDDVVALSVLARDVMENPDVAQAFSRGPGRYLAAIGIDEVAETEDLELATDVLVYAAHWITPKIRPKRFDTHFFLAPAPADHVAMHDGSESLDSLWETPRQVFTDFKGGIHLVMFPTYCNLWKLNRSRSVAEALERARGERVVTILGQHEKAQDGSTRVVLPKDAGFDLTEVPDPKEPSGRRFIVYR